MQQIVDAVVAQANITRAVIRLPIGSRARFVIAVADLDGTLIALHRMPDATIFSIDVAVGKSRNVIFFSGPNRTASDLPGVPMGTAVTNRTIGFGGQPIYPPGIDGTAPGPFFPLYLFDTLNPCTQGSDTTNPQNQNGIVFFPGAVPLYRNGVLVGGLGVSGDGVDQDDFATSAGEALFPPPPISAPIKLSTRTSDSPISSSPRIRRIDRRLRATYFVCITQTPFHSSGGGFCLKCMHQSTYICGKRSVGLRMEASANPSMALSHWRPR